MVINIYYSQHPVNILHAVFILLLLAGLDGTVKKNSWFIYVYRVQLACCSLEENV